MYISSQNACCPIPEYTPKTVYRSIVHNSSKWKQLKYLLRTDE